MRGTRLGPYEILQQLGAGGMGEVWLAHDTRLERQVAVKILPSEFASDPERLARFQQEARAAAALSHPHIAAVFDVGEAHGIDGAGTTHYMVQEYLQGQTLRGALREGRLALKRALTLGGEIARALTAAHRAGIVHRDLKPENLFVTEDGHVKVLDFGLAKLTELPGAAPSRATMSPTAPGTMAGQIMGSVGYMAPEQVDGRPVDHRADVFAFGCVLFEMCCGQRAFSGSSAREILHRIGHVPAPALADIDETLPAELQRILHKALAKDPGDRYQHADDLVVDLRVLATEVETGTAPAAARELAARSPAATTGLTWALALTTLAAVAVAAWAVSTRATATDEITRLAVPLQSLALSRSGDGRMLAISADGRQIIAKAVIGGEEVLVRRQLDSDQATILPMPAGGAQHPVMSPDGEWVATFGATRAYKTSLNTGARTELSRLGGSGSDLDWGRDGLLLLSSGGSLWRVPLDGSDAEQVATPPRGSGILYRRPNVLPSGRAALVEAASAEGQPSPRLAVVDLESGEFHDLGVPGTAPTYATSGHIIYALDGKVTAVPFDAKSLTVTGSPTLLPEPVVVDGLGVPLMDVSDNGTLIYVPKEEFGRDRLVWVDRSGAESPLDVPGLENLRSLGDMRVSPDGERIVLTAEETIWSVDLPSQTLTLVAGGQGQSFYPLWMGNTSRVLFSADRGGPFEIVSRQADSSAAEEQTFRSANPLRTAAWVLAHDEVLFREQTAERGMDILAAKVDGFDKARPVLDGPYDEISPAVSPDGRWLAYVTPETGRDEVWLTSYPEPSRRVQVSQEGGREPVWSPTRSELYYWWGDRFFAAQVVTSPELRVERREQLFERPFVRYRWQQQYDVHPDGDRFLMVAGPSTATNVRVTTNWFKVLRELTSPGQ